MAGRQAVRLVKPWRYPHREGKVYTQSGFRLRVARRLRDEGFSRRDVEKLEELYFGSRSVRCHQDDDGIYRNVRSFRLYQLCRRCMKYDRKNRLFRLVIRSGMFYVYLDDEGRVLGFVSPREVKKWIIFS